MIILEYFLFCVPLRLGCLILSYFIILRGFLSILYVMVTYKGLCEYLMIIWFLQAQIDIVAGVVLLGAAYNPNNYSYLLPVQIVVKLVSLIVELIFYLLSESMHLLHEFVVFYSFCSVLITGYVVLVVYSFYQKMEDPADSD